MTEVYCGIKPLKKGQRYGSMKECAERNQVRRFGLYKIDKILLDSIGKKDDSEIHKGILIFTKKGKCKLDTKMLKELSEKKKTDALKKAQVELNLQAGIIKTKKNRLDTEMGKLERKMKKAPDNDEFLKRFKEIHSEIEKLFEQHKSIVSVYQEIKALE